MRDLRVAPAVVLAGVALALLLATSADAGFPGVSKLSVDRIDELEGAILHNAGQPWLVGCHLSGDKAKRDTLTALLTGAADLLSADPPAGGSSKDDGGSDGGGSDDDGGGKKKRRKRTTRCPDCRIGELDCRKQLPTGKSVARTLGVNLDAFKKGWPVLVFAANGRAAVQIDPKHFSKKDKIDKLKAYMDATVLAQHVARSAPPKVRSVASEFEMREHCLKQPHCVALLLGRNGAAKGTVNKLSRAQTRTVRAAMKQHRTVSVVSVDMAKWELRLPGVKIPDAPGADDELELRPPRVLAFRRAANVTDPATARAKAAKKAKASGKDDSSSSSSSSTGSKKKSGKSGRKKGKKGAKQKKKSAAELKAERAAAEKAAEKAAREANPPTFRHLNLDAKLWEPNANKAPRVALSLCRHLITRDTGRLQARRLFEKHRVELSQLNKTKKPEALLRSDKALFKINGRYCSYATAAPFLASAALFGNSLGGDVWARLDAKAAFAERAAARAAREKRGTVVTARPMRGDFNVDNLVSFVGDLHGGRLRMPTLRRRARLLRYESKEQRRLKKQRKYAKRAKAKEDAADRKEQRKLNRKMRRARQKYSKKRKRMSKAQMELERREKEMERRAAMDREMEESGMTAEAIDDDDEIVLDDDEDDEDDAYDEEEEEEDDDEGDDDEEEEEDDDDVIDVDDVDEAEEEEGEVEVEVDASGESQVEADAEEDGDDDDDDDELFFEESIYPSRIHFDP